MIEARFCQREEEAVICGLCPHKCAIRGGQTGLCGARRNSGGILFAESYGQFSSLALDPIEKKPLRHFLPGSRILSAGSYGCNMSCAFCQNYEISQKTPQTRFILPEKLLEAAKSAGSVGIAFTYNEPLISIEYLLDAAPLFRKAGLKVVLVTNGMALREPLTALLPYIDAANIDLKSFSPEYYRTMGGDLSTVLQTIELCAEACHIEVTALIVPGQNDSGGEMEKLAGWLASLSDDIPLHITRFFPRHRLAAVPPTPLQTLNNLSERAKRSLRNVYLGNV